MEDADEVRGLDMILVADDNCNGRWRLEFRGGDDADSFLNSFFIASDGIDDDAGVSGGGALLPDVCFFVFDPMPSEEESCVFCATC